MVPEEIISLLFYNHLFAMAFSQIVQFVYISCVFVDDQSRNIFVRGSLK